MQADRAIDMLDRMLAADGEDITLRKVVGSSPQTNVGVDCRAFVVKQKRNPRVELGTIEQVICDVVVSPTPINAAGWPSAQPVDLRRDVRIPEKGDRIILADGQVLNIETAKGVYISKTLVRINIWISGWA